MDVQLMDDGRKGMFYIEESGSVSAKLLFRRLGNGNLVLEHTEVAPTEKGKGLGQQLLEATVNKARQESFKLIVACPFAKVVFERHTEWHDVVDRITV